jgi:hypothetical protein
MMETLLAFTTPGQLKGGQGPTLTESSLSIANLDPPLLRRVGYVRPVLLQLVHIGRFSPLSHDTGQSAK